MRVHAAGRDEEAAAVSGRDQRFAVGAGVSGLGCAGRSALLRELPELPPANDLEITDHSLEHFHNTCIHSGQPDEGVGSPKKLPIFRTGAGTVYPPVEDPRPVFVSPSQEELQQNWKRSSRLDFFDRP